MTRIFFNLFCCFLNITINLGSSTLRLLAFQNVLKWNFPVGFTKYWTFLTALKGDPTNSVFTSTYLFSFTFSTCLYHNLFPFSLLLWIWVLERTFFFVPFLLYLTKRVHFYWLFYKCNDFLSCYFLISVLLLLLKADLNLHSGWHGDKKKPLSCYTSCYFS